MREVILLMVISSAFTFGSENQINTPGAAPLKARITLVGDRPGWHDTKPVIVLIPGGPGMSSKPLQSILPLARSYELAFVDPPGTGGLSDEGELTLKSILDAIEREILALGRPVILAGHSFGAIYAAELALRKTIPIKGVLFLAAPLRSETLDELDKNYEKNMTKALQAAADRWDKTPSNETFRTWLAECNNMFFIERNQEAGYRLVASDTVSHKTFLTVRTNWKPAVNFLSTLKSLPVPKLMIAGEYDKLLPPDLLKKDAEATNSEFVVIKDAGHFMTFDQPNVTADEIGHFFQTNHVE